VSISVAPIHATYPAHLIPLNLINLIIFDVHKPWSPSLCIFLHSAVTSSLTSAAPEAAFPPHTGGRPIVIAASLSTGHCHVGFSSSLFICVRHCVMELFGKMLVLLLILFVCLFVCGWVIVAHKNDSPEGR
jgi:hypothetical protein